MKFLVCIGLVALFGLVSSKSPFFKTETVEIDSSEHGGPPGNKKTTCACGWSNKKSLRVVGGKETKVNEYPFAVALIDNSKNFQFCGGTILTENHVVTAAHCTEDYVKSGNTNSISVSAGNHNLKSNTQLPDAQLIDVLQILQHQDYDPKKMLNDISVLLLTKPILFSQRVGPCCILNSQINLETKTVKVIGWGKTSHVGPASSVLKSVNLRVVPHNKCVELYPNMQTTPRKQICTHSQRQGACMGDSGGPLVWLDPETNRYTLVGVVSFGRICGNDPSVFTDSSAYMTWIQRQIKTNSGSRSGKTCHKAYDY